MRISDVIDALDELAPLSLAEDWDNVGLLVGRPSAAVSAVMTCLTLTSDVLAEAIAGDAQLIVSHHPLMFRPIQRITSETIEGRILLEVIQNEIAVYSPHTGYDSAAAGINQQLATSLALSQVQPLRPAVGSEQGDNGGAGRHGVLPAEMTLVEFNQRVQSCLNIRQSRFVGTPDQRVRRVAVACGAAAEFLVDADRLQCDVLLTGEARFHDCLQARSLGIGLVLPGHFATEHPAMTYLSDCLHERFENLRVWASQQECDPLHWS
ncbi:MAG: Nif3-like dinuclear metal center hexameric protein [Planctomycetaceae bacterium]